MCNHILDLITTSLHNGQVKTVGKFLNLLLFYQLIKLKHNYMDHKETVEHHRQNHLDRITNFLKEEQIQDIIDNFESDKSTLNILQIITIKTNRNHIYFRF